jgi:hypothetical protein
VDDGATFLSIPSPYSQVLERYWEDNVHQKAFKMMTHHNMALVINGEFLVSVTGREEQQLVKPGMGDMPRTEMQA